MDFKFKGKKKVTAKLFSAVLALVIASSMILAGCANNTDDVNGTEGIGASTSAADSSKPKSSEKAQSDGAEAENGSDDKAKQETSSETEKNGEEENTEPKESRQKNNEKTVNEDSSKESTEAKTEGSEESASQPSEQPNTQSTQPVTKPAENQEKPTETGGTTEPATEKPEETVPAVQEKVCVVNISCATVLNNMDKLKEEKKDIVPPGGIILSGCQIEIQEGDSAYEVLKRACQENRIHMDSDFTPAYGSAYIKGIGNIYERDCGSLSGWTYRVNGVFPSVGCSSYEVHEGDVVEFLYTCDMGADVGNTYP